MLLLDLNVNVVGDYSHLSRLLTSLQFHLFLCLLDLIQEGGVSAPSVKLLRVGAGATTNDIHWTLRLQVHRSTRQAIGAEECFNVGEHVKETVLVEEAPDYLIEARRVVQDIPKAVL